MNGCPCLLHLSSKRRMEEQEENKNEQHLELSSEERNETEGGQLIFNPLPKYLSRSGVQTITAVCENAADRQVLGNT